jgi:hypothetical protein
MKLVDEINAFELRKGIEGLTCLASGLIGLTSWLIGGSVAIAEKQVDKPILEEGPVPRACWTIGLVFGVICVASFIPLLLDLPSGIVKKLNDWAINRAQAQGIKPEEGAP